MDKMGKGQFLRGNRRNLAEEGVVRKNSSPQRVASVSNLCNSRSQGAGNMSNGECCFNLLSSKLFSLFVYCRHLDNLIRLESNSFDNSNGRKFLLSFCCKLEPGHAVHFPMPVL